MGQLKIIIVIDQPVEFGGGFTYSIYSSKLWIDAVGCSHDIVIFTTIINNIEKLKEVGLDAKFLSRSGFDLVCTFPWAKFIHPRIRSLLHLIISRKNLDKFFVSENADLVYFTSNSPLARNLKATNFVFTVWDLAYLEHPEFPEKGNSYTEDELYKTSLHKAVAVIVESNLTKEKLVKKFQIDDDRIFIVPLLPSQFVLDGLQRSYTVNKFGLVKESYIYYPAQYWPHKNHIYILEAVSFLLSEDNICIKVVFSGIDYGNLDYLKEAASALGISNHVLFFGFVSNDEYISLMKNALALVMPTYFGPTNIPPLDAFILNVPVVYSGTVSFSDDVLAGTYPIDLSDPLSLKKILIILLRERPLSTGISQAASSYIDNNLSHDRIGVIKTIIKRYFTKRKCWR